MQTQDFARIYEEKPDAELQLLSAQADHLTSEAYAALVSEMSRRGIAIESPPASSSATTRPNPTQSSEKLQTRPFIEEVFRIYRSNLGLFIKLSAPAVVLGYIAHRAARTEVREIARHIPRDVFLITQHRLAITEMALINHAGYFVAWMSFCFCFGAITFATEELEQKLVPSARECFISIRHRVGPLIRLSLSLYIMTLALPTVASLLESGFFEISRHFHFQLTAREVYWMIYITFAVCALIMCRFALSIPALLLDDYKVWKAIFRSDELTEGKWPVLALLLFKSVIGSYVAGMSPFWIAQWTWPNLRFPSWALIVASIVAVSVVDSFMFIGFALLYLKQSRAIPSRRRVSNKISLSNFFAAICCF